MQAQKKCDNKKIFIPDKVQTEIAVHKEPRKKKQCIKQKALATARYKSTPRIHKQNTTSPITRNQRSGSIKRSNENTKFDDKTRVTMKAIERSRIRYLKHNRANKVNNLTRD